VRIKDNEDNSLKVALKSSNQERGYNMATKFYLAEIPDDFPATNVKFENMTKPLLAIPAKMVDGKPITIVGYINAGQKKYKANDYGFVEFNDNGSSFVQFKNTDMDTRYSVAQKASGDVLGYLPLETGELVGIVREKEKPILLLIIAVIAALVLLVALITASLYKMVNKPLDGSGSDASSASSEIVIADGEAYDGTMDNGKTDSEEMRFIEFPAFTTIYVSPDSTVDLVNPESNHVYFKYIAPGQKYAWQASDYITGAGEHAVVFSVSTVGVDDQQPRNGAEFSVTAVVS